MVDSHPAKLEESMQAILTHSFASKTGATKITAFLPENVEDLPIRNILALRRYVGGTIGVDTDNNRSITLTKSFIAGSSTGAKNAVQAFRRGLESIGVSVITQPSSRCIAH